MVSVRRRCINKRREPNPEGQDIISTLPDFCIGHILSFVPTKDAVRTSVLSKRWKYMWTFITGVEIEDRDPLCRKKIRKIPFYKFVEKILLHLKSSNIKRFSLSLSESYNHCRANKWMHDILNMRVKELYIVSMTKLDISWHSSLLKSESLEVLVLDLSLCATNTIISVPSFVCLSSLTVLKFSGITFTCYPFNQMLSLNFPVLREFETKKCNWPNVKGITFEVPLLEVLSIISYTCLPIFEEVLSNTIIKFCAPRLAEFSYTCYMSVDPNLLDLSTTRISSANISIFPYICIGENVENIRASIKIQALRACDILKKFNTNVECLTLKWPEVPALAQNDLPTFGMLSKLELGFVTGKILLIILRKTPCLKNLTLKGLDNFDEDLSKPDCVASCFISNLQVINFSGVYRYEHELRFVKYVLKSAQVLERMNFSANWLSHIPNYEDVKEKIFSFMRTSRFVRINFLPLSD